jgi:red chlorophyll catabolite reductase
VSPTAITVRIETEASGQGRMEEVIKGHIDPAAKKVLGIWFDQCACGEREVGETERASLEKFGPEVAERVLGSVREFFTA